MADSWGHCWCSRVTAAIFAARSQAESLWSGMQHCSDWLGQGHSLFSLRVLLLSRVSATLISLAPRHLPTSVPSLLRTISLSFPSTHLPRMTHTWEDTKISCFFLDFCFLINVPCSPFFHVWKAFLHTSVSDSALENSKKSENVSWI